MAENAELLRAAAELIGTHGHCKGIVEDSEGRFCLVGALGEVTRGNTRIWDAHRAREPWTRMVTAIGNVIREQFPDRKFGVVNFNNHPDTTGDDVIAVLEKAAARLEEANGTGT